MFETLKNLFSGSRASFDLAKARAEVKEGAAVLIDIRTAAEFQQAHLKGALNFDPMQPDFPRQITSLDPEQHYYLYCRTGNRSGKAAAMMQKAGYQHAVNLGGLGELQRAGFDVV